MTPVLTVGCFAAGQLTESIIDPEPLPWRVVQDALRKEQLIEAFKTFDKARVRNADRGLVWVVSVVSLDPFDVNGTGTQSTDHGPEPGKPLKSCS